MLQTARPLGLRFLDRKAMDIYEYDYGTCQTEQDFATALNTFLVTTIGDWELYDTVSDTSSNRDYVWKSPGEDPDNYREIFIRVRTQSDNIYSYGYGSWTSAAVYGQELHSFIYSYTSTNAKAFKYWMYGNKDFVCFTILNSNDGYTYTSYLGLIESSYVPEDDPYPLLARGHRTSDHTWHASGYNYMHAPVASGSQQYFSINWDTLLDNEFGLRSNDLLFMPVILRNSTASNNEVRGRPYGVYQVDDRNAPKLSPIVTASGVFLCFKHGSVSYTDRTYAYGPVAADIDSFNM